MKWSLFSLPFLISSTLVGDDCCCEWECCEEWKPNLVEHKCYTPAYYDNACLCGRAVHGGIFYWQAKEMNLPYALTVKMEPINQEENPTLAFAPEKVSYLGTKWQPGFRFGTGWTSNRDGWDGVVTWTYFPGSKSSGEELPFFDTLPTEVNQEALINPWINPVTRSVLTNQATILFNEIDAQWKLYFNQVDLEIARKYWISENCTLRPYTGARVAWIKSEFETLSYLNFGDPIFDSDGLLSFQDKFTTHTIGGGLLGGIESSWLFGRRCGFFGNAALALLWQKEKTHKKEDYTSDNQDEFPLIAYRNKTSEHTYNMQSVLDLLAGVRWDFKWCCDRLQLTLDAGWEQHFWFNYNRLHTVAGSYNTIGQMGFQTFDQKSSNLVLGGGFARLRIGF